MFDDSKLIACSRLFAKVVFAGGVFLCSMGNAFAAANLNTSSASFTSADPARTNSYMDADGVWDGNNEVSNVGDTFTLTIANTANGLPILADDIAYDLQNIIVTVDPGFLLASNSLSVNKVVGACPDISTGTAQQPGGAGNNIRLNIDNNVDIEPGCIYELSFGLTTTNAVTAGAHPVKYTISYNSIDNNNGSQVDVTTTQNIDVRSGALSVTKSTTTVTAIDGDVITYNITVSSTGSGGLFDVVLNDVISADLINLNFTVPDPPPGSITAADEYTFEYLAAGEVVNLTVDATVAPAVASTCPVLQNDASLSERTGNSTDVSGPVLVDYDFNFTSGLTTSVVTHNSFTSFCEFCGDGEVRLIVKNPENAALENITIVEDLLASGLTYIPGSTTTTSGTANDPSINGTQLTWTPAQLSALGSLAGSSFFEIRFGVRRLDEGLITANRNIIATANFSLSCLAGAQTVDSGFFEVPIHQPLPRVLKRGRNYDAGQGGYSDPVYGSTNDDIIFQVRVRNTGLANLEALRINDAINGNFNINYICPTQVSAVAIAAANGVGGAPCIAMTTPFDVDDPFGNPANDETGTYYDVPANGDAFIYYVGRVLNGCSDNINFADISWGCEINSPAGGLITVPASTGGFTPFVGLDDTGALRTNDKAGGNLNVGIRVTGIDGAQPLGSKGLVEITLTNNTNGSLKNLTLRDILPAGYVMDNTYNPANPGTPTIVVNPAYNSYPGMTDTITRVDAAYATADPLDDLVAEFVLSSSTVGLNAAEQVNMLRHNDVIVITFGIVMIEPDLNNYTHYDLVADIDVLQENTADGTDPTNSLALNNQVFVDFVNICTPGTGLTPPNYPQILNFTSNPEDLDVAMSAPLYIVTNDPVNPVALTVLLTNNGGHDAADYYAYLSFGEAMTIVTPAAGCSITSNPPLRSVWDLPDIIPQGPPAAVIYECTGPPIGPGQTVPLTFTATQNLNPLSDDLTFRADVIGEITLADGTPLTFPTPLTTTTTPAAQIDNTVNNYTLDSVRSRVLGFNLTKVVPGNCSEDNPPPIANSNITIGEDCTYHIESGGWFGFQTPGFALIEVNNVVVTDDLPDGQGYINHNFTLTGNITKPIVINGGAGSTALDEVDITWAFNPPGQGIVIRDELFQVDVTTRLLNDPVDNVAAPNIHAGISTDIARTSFDAIFVDTFGNRLTIPVDDIINVPPGYPVEALRRVDMTVTEPNLLVSKQVCNESLNGAGPNCNGGVFADAVNDGDTNDSYIYKIVLTNEANSSGVQRAPAYDVISTDILDISDLMLIEDFADDGLDNDGDGAIDETDEGSISDNIVDNNAPAEITFSYTHSAPLLRVDPGDSVTFYYRVDPDDAIAPLQTLTNTVTMSYDSLVGDSGNQNNPQLDNTTIAPNDAGRARIYASIPADAIVQMVPIQTRPKSIIELSNSAPGGAPQEVVVGEEIRYELVTSLPFASLDDFKITDNLPAGTRCIEGQVVNLNEGIYAAAGFDPGGTHTGTCIAPDVMQWNFGLQKLTASSVPGARFNFPVNFIARVENTAFTNEGVVIRNGGGIGVGGTEVTATYLNESGTLVEELFLEVDVVVREPVIELSKSFVPVVNSDAGDILTVTVTATNTGTAAAYNLRVLDDLLDTDMTYVVGSMAGTDPPDNDDLTPDNKHPIFSWDITNPKYEITPGTVRSFTFQVQVDTTAQPLEKLDNTIEAAWNSLPSQNTALNGTGSIGADGTVLGLRNGLLSNAANVINDYETSASASTSVPPLTMSKSDLDPTVIPNIGAHKNFQIEITLPEGTSNNLVVTDDLNFSGLSYVLSNNALFDVTYEFIDIVSINGESPAEEVFKAFPADNAAGSVVWDIGTVVTEEENDPSVSNKNPIIRIKYFARFNNDPATNVAGSLQNAVTVNYDNGETAGQETLTATTPVETVVESLLTVSKTVTNQTAGKLPADLPDGGDILEYQVTINNIGNTTAFDVNIVDSLPAELLLDAGFTPTAEINAVSVVDFVAIPAAAPAGPLVWGRNNADNSLDIPAGESLLLIYRTVVQTTTGANTVISNSVLIDWTSLNDSDPASIYERTGASCPVAPDDYCAGPAIATVTMVDTNSLVKTVIADTYVVPPLSTADDGIVRIGDIVTYRLDVNIQEGLTDNVKVQDVLPAGLTFVDVVSINGDTTAGYEPPLSGAGSNFSYAAIPAGNAPAAGATGTLNWVLGSIINDAAGDATTDSFVIEYRAHVTENAGLAHVNSITLSNTADFSYVDGNGNPSPIDPRLTDSAGITVLQPIVQLADLTKVRRSGLPSGNTISSGELMDFRLSVCNSGDAPAYDLIVEDILPVELNEATITAPVVTINGAAVTAGSDYVYTAPAGSGGSMNFLFNNEAKPVNPGQCAVIEYDINVAAIGANAIFVNQFQAVEYHSLDSDNANQLLRETYGLVGPVIFSMNTFLPAIVTPDKALLSPLSFEATIGEEVVYQIKVPGDSGIMSVTMFDIRVVDDMATNLTFVDATLDPLSAYQGAIDASASSGNQVRVSIDALPVVAGVTQQAVINIRARVNNDANTNAVLPLPTPPFGNLMTYSFAASAGGIPINGGSAATPGTDDISIVEPVVTLTSKTVVNQTQANVLTDAGDILRYTLVIDAAAGATESDAFDISVLDSLAPGLVYSGNPTVSGTNTIAAPVLSGDDVTAPQTLTWDLAAGTDIDIAEGGSVTITYDVLVLDPVQALQALSNSAQLQWTSLDGDSIFERNGSNSPAFNDYFSALLTSTVTTPDNNIISKTRLSDTHNPADNVVRVGDIIDYELRIRLQEGSNPNFVIKDNLPQGLAYEETVSINGDTTAPYAAAAPFTHSNIPAAVVVGDPAAGLTSVTWTAGTVVNAGDNLANNDFVIVYRARVLNLVHPQLNNIALSNTVNFDYDTAAGVAPTKADNELLDLQQPDLSITKVAAPVGGDTIIDAGELITYTVDIKNNGVAAAYDTVLRDIIPVGLRNGAATITMVSTQLLVAGAVLPNLAPVYDAVSGIATWNFDTGDADAYNIPAGDTLRLVYRVQADAGLGAGLVMTNEAQIQLYYSFDNNAVPVVAGITGVREIYGPSNVAQVTLTTDAPNALLKQNPLDLLASIGETFTYRITVPEVKQTTALHDVRILDDLNIVAADLRFVSITKVSGSLPWVPVNVGVPGTGNLIIADVNNGIDIPANEQAVIDVTVTMRNISPPNDDGLLFSNAASYTFNQINGDNTTQGIGAGNPTHNMTVVEPDLTLDKRGPVGTVNFSAPIPYTLVVENIGSGPAFDTTIVDRLPNVPDIPALIGGTCDVTPVNFNARITSAANELAVVRALAQGTDYTVTYTAAPTCEVVITTLSDAARVEASEKFIIDYDAMLNVGSQSGATLTNIAGITRWFSMDTAGAGVTGEIREYTRIISNGTTAIVDHEDAFTVTVEAPVLDIQKTVVNVTTTQDPGRDASPGDILRYSIRVQNIGPVALPDFSLTDEVDALALPGGFFEPGTMANFAIPAGADNSNTDINGGANGAGLLDVRKISIDAAGGLNDTVVIEFDVRLLPVISSATVILNQAQINSLATGVLLSDAPLIGGTEDPTETLIASAPAFLVQKISQDQTGDLTVLEAGDILRYTLTVKNIGQENAVEVLLSDQIPPNTIYVAGTTTLNTVVVVDPSAGVSALATGMLINAPEDTTAGAMRADLDPAANNIATITFDVEISATVVDGAVISNQGFVSGKGAGSGVFPQQPSDDPDTALPDDPTLDVVGNVPVVDVLKTVAIEVDNNPNGLVDPGDTLRYTITVSNLGAIPATNVVLTDDLDLPVAGQITYVAGSGLLDGLPAGISFFGSVLTATIGDLLASSASVVIFDVLVDASLTAGTIISNQGFVSSNEVPVEPSDADGIDANGDQPTDIVVGNVQLLAITKQVFVVGGGVALAGGELEYVVRVTNIGGVAASNVVITDELDLGQMTYIAGSGLLNGLPAGIDFTDPTVTADHATTYGDLAVAGIAELRFRVELKGELNIGSTVSNTGVVNWDGPASPLSADVDIGIGGTPGAANLNGQLWHDANFDNIAGSNEALLQDYRVELYHNNVLLANTQTDANGGFQFSGLVPVHDITAGSPYEIRFTAPGTTASTATLGQASSVFTNGPQKITDIFAASGSSIQNLNLPRQPNGIVYDSVLRLPVPGAQLRMVYANEPPSNQLIPANCFADPNHQNQVTSADGYYKFDLDLSDPACIRDKEYAIQVQPPANGYVGTTSVINAPAGAVLDVPACPSTALDKIPATTEHCENSVSAVQPDPSIAPGAAGSEYNLQFVFSVPPPLPGTPFTDQIFNNHIPVDPELESAVAISKVAGKLNVVRSDLVPYTITINNTLPVPLHDLNVIDNFPAGFKYVSGSSRIDGVDIEPLVNGRQLTWQNLSVDVSGKRVIKMLLVVGSGVGEGEYVNTAQVINSDTNEPFSGVASATVRVIPDPTFDCTDIIGKVFDDKNNNSYQDQGETGIAGVQVATARGLRVTTDTHGRFHITCAIVPNETRGSNFIMKLDDRTLPSGYRVTTENPRVQRATRGKMLKFNFGATVHRVVRLDLADGVFEKGSTELRPQWQTRIDLLIIELQKDASILRLSYLGENETESEVEDRLDAIEELISDRWEDLDCCYKLTIETEVFWRKGRPSERKVFE